MSAHSRISILGRDGDLAMSEACLDDMEYREVNGRTVYADYSKVRADVRAEIEFDAYRYLMETR